MEQSLLFACSGNVCRSPLMAFTYAQAVRHGAGETWTISSAGVQVVRAKRMCSVAAGLIAHEPAGAQFAASHAAVALDPDLLRQHDLIVTASREERAAIARMTPDLRGRTFALKEAVALGRDGFAPDLPPAPHGTHVPPLARYAELLNKRRGSVAVEAPRRLRLPWTSSVNPQDIPDVHHENKRTHVGTLKGLREAVATLHAQIDGFLAAHRDAP